MPTRNPKPFVWQPTGCSDALDGAEAFPGAMTALSDLVPSLTTMHQWVARPPATQIAAISSGRPISGMITVGDILYGMIGNGAGGDVPFAYNLATNTALTVSGVTAANTPTQAPTSGAWTPPILAQVASRVVVTHPGFSGASINSAASNQFISNPFNTSFVTYGAYTTTQVGDALFGTHIAAGATASVIIIVNGTSTACSGTQGQNTFSFSSGFSGTSPFPGFSLTSLANLGVVGQVTNVVVSGPTTTVTYSGTNPNTFSGASISWAGMGIQMSLAATGTAPASGDTITSIHQAASGATYKCGWFDISGASITYTANLINGNPVISLPSAFGLQPGMTVSGTGIPANTTILNISIPSITLTGSVPNFGDVMLTVTTANTNSIPISGMTITGAGLIPGTLVANPPTVTGYSAGLFTVLIPLNIPAAGTVGLNSASYSFTGLTAIVLNNNATVTGSQSLTFAGGTASTPLWGAGDTSYNPLPSQPVSVAQMGGRAYFACGVNGFPFSDSGFASQRTNASQAVVPSDGLAITALGALPLLSPITGGIVQAIIGFSSLARMYQITGDAALGNLSLNVMNVSTGTNSPLAIVPTSLGLAIIGKEGMRIITQQGTITDPIGNPANGEGVSFPFQDAVQNGVPSRIVGAANSDVIRFTITTSGGVDQEWYYYISYKRWVGPHSSAYSMITSWRNTFVGQLKSVQQNAVTQGVIYNGRILPFTVASYVEAGFAMSYTFKTVTLPDNPEQNSLGVVEAYIWLSTNLNSATITAFDETQTALDTVVLTPTNTKPYVRMIPIDQQWVFRSAQVQITGPLDNQLAIGRLGLKYLDLGYQRYNS